jgi:hypothetical protein
LAKQNDVTKALFKKKYAAMIFETWRQHAMAVVQDLRDDDVRDSTAMKLLVSVLNLVADCTIVKSKEQLDTLREKRNVDWQKCFKEVSHHIT